MLQNLRTCGGTRPHFLEIMCGTASAIHPGMGKEYDLKKRTMKFALAVSDLCEVFPNTMKGRHVAGQLFRAGTAVAANYRAACRGKSTPDFIAKLGTVIEEGDESDFMVGVRRRRELTEARSSTSPPNRVRRARRNLHRITDNRSSQPEEAIRKREPEPRT